MTTLFVGLSTLDIQYFVDKFPGSNVKLKTEEPKLLVGGPATNAAVANSFLGGKSVLLSGVGDSPFKELFTKDFNECGIKHLDFYNGKKQLPVLASVITSRNNGDRTIFTCNPGSSNFKIDLRQLVDEISPEQILIDGFYPEIAIPICRLAKTKCIPVILDGGSWKPQFHDILRYVDYAICSANFHPPGCKSRNNVIDYLTQAGISKVAITNGAEQIHFNEQNRKGEIQVPKIEAVDTLGAGDFFHGAFCFYNRLESSFENAIKRASVVASKSCEYPGTRDWLKKLSKETFLS